MNELKFDAMKVNTQLAEDYVQKNASRFNITISALNARSRPAEYTWEVLEKLRKLATKVVENSELFCQLEVYSRKLSRHDVLTDLKLLTQNLKHNSVYGKLEDRSEVILPVVCILLDENTPLSALGYVAQATLQRRDIMIVASNATVAVGYLFYELCYDVGLHVGYSFAEFYLERNSDITILNTMKDQSSGCTGVVSERSDLDSAVDAFLASTTKYPWKLRRIFVQESVYESFKQVMLWKCKEETAAVVDKSITDLCTQVYLYDDKLFLLDYAGIEVKHQKETILVEAYRTTKELLALLKKHNQFFVSLWSSDISEANEIAFGINVPIVWVNDFGTFDGAAKTSQAFFTPIGFDLKKVKNSTKIEKLRVLKETWHKLSFENRIEKVFDAIERFNTENKDELSISFAKQLFESKSDICRSNKHVEIQNGRSYICIDEPMGVVLEAFMCCHSKFVKLLKSIIHGNLMVFVADDRIDSTQICFLNLVKIFEKLGVPVVCIDSVEYESNDGVAVTVNGDVCYKTKAVWMNFGTTFAN